MLAFTLIFALDAGCGRPRDDRSAAEIREETQAKALPKVVGKWVLDRETTLKQSFDSFGGAMTAINGFGNDIAKATLDFELNEDASFTCHQIMGSHEANYLGSFTIDGNVIVLNQTHRMEASLLPDAPEMPVEEKDRLSGELKDGKLHLIHKQGNTSIKYVLMRP